MKPGATRVSANLQPTHLALDSQGRLVIQWGDGSRRAYDVGDLRRNCPCATCRTQREATADDPAAGRPPVEIRQMSPVGNYAYKIAFSDNHSTGIYPLALLRQLGEEHESAEK
jgi:DUF971 family protein